MEVIVLLLGIYYIAMSSLYIRKELADITQTLLEFIKSTLESGTDALVGGFGKFCVK